MNPHFSPPRNREQNVTRNGGPQIGACLILSEVFTGGSFRKGVRVPIGVLGGGVCGRVQVGGCRGGFVMHICIANTQDFLYIAPFSMLANLLMGDRHNVAQTPSFRCRKKGVCQHDFDRNWAIILRFQIDSPLSGLNCCHCVARILFWSAAACRL